MTGLLAGLFGWGRALNWGLRIAESILRNPRIDFSFAIPHAESISTVLDKLKDGNATDEDVADLIKEIRTNL